MRDANLFVSKPPADTIDVIACEKYERGAGRRCRHYRANGTCALPDEFMCVEWLRVNGYARPRASARPPEGEPSAVMPRRIGDLTAEDVESFKRLGVEVCLSYAGGEEVWLVPERTGKDRNEITPEQALALMRAIEAFPGSKLITIEQRLAHTAHATKGVRRP